MSLSLTVGSAIQPRPLAAAEFLQAAGGRGRFLCRSAGNVLHCRHLSSPFYLIIPGCAIIVIVEREVFTTRNRNKPRRLKDTKEIEGYS